MSQSTNISSVINLGLSASVPDVFKDPEVRAATELYIRSFNNLIAAIEQYCGVSQKAITDWSTLAPSDTLLRQNLGRMYCKAFEPIGVGAFVNIFLSGGVAQMRNARSDTPRKAHGYNNSGRAIVAGDYGEVIMGQGLLTISGLAAGSEIYLSTTPGSASTTPDTAAGHLEQYLGIGVSANLAYIDITMGQYIQH